MSRFMQMIRVVRSAQERSYGQDEKGQRNEEGRWELAGQELS